MSTYKILVRQDRDHPEAWQEAGTQEASSAEQAVRKYAEKAEGNLTAVAVPERSWAPLSVTVATERKVSIGAPAVKPRAVEDAA